jgi:GTPase SAR1 family protein
VFLLCYDITNRNSFDNISSKWSLETSKHSPSAKLFIVGTKLDKREKCETPVSSVEGEQMMNGVGAVGCAQVSAATGENIQELFTQLVQIAGQKYAEANAHK